MFRASVLRARALGSRRGVLVAATASVVFLVGLARGGTAVSWNRQADGQSFTDSYTDAQGHTSTYNWTWPDNANWTQSLELGTSPASGRTITIAPSNWSQPDYPDGDYDVSLGGNQVTLNANVSIDTLNLGGELDFLSGTSINITGGSVTNNGTMVINWDTGAYSTSLSFASDASLSGSGHIILNNDGGAAQISVAESSTLTIGSGQTISGLGYMSGGFINNGTINASITDSTLAISGDLTNTAALEATSHGTLSLNGTIINSGTITAGIGTLMLQGTLQNTGPNAVVTVDGKMFLNAATIDGGTITVPDEAGDITLTGAATIKNATLSIGRQTQIFIHSGTSLTFDGTMDLTNNGAIIINDDQGIYGTSLVFNSDVTVGGFGDIIMSGNGSASLATAPGTTLTLGPTQFLFGIGNINASIINHGSIQADEPGMALIIGSYDIENDGDLDAANQTTLNISAIKVANSAGMITAHDHSDVQMNSATIDGGSVSATSDSKIVWSSSTISGNITLSGPQEIPSGFSLTMTGSELTNNGTITVNPGQGIYATSLNFDADASLDGSGEILLNESGGTAQLNVVNSHTLTIQSGAVVDGQGYISGDIINYGTVSANVAGQYIQVTPATGFSNYGTFNATGGGSLQFSGQFNNYTTIGIAASSTLTLSSATISNSTTGNVDIAGHLVISYGTLEGGSVNVSAAGASVQVINGPATIQNTNFTLGTGNHLDIDSGNSLSFAGMMNLTNNGTISIDADRGIYGTSLNFNSTMTIGGSGDIVLTSGGGASSFNTTAGATVTLGSGQTLHGTGIVNAAITNHGTINADAAGKSLDLGSYGVTNDGAIRATNQGILNISAIAVDNTSGQVAASNNSAIAIFGSTITGGTVSASTDSYVDWSASTISGWVTLSGTHNIRGGSTDTVNGPLLTNNGKIVINSDSNIYGTVLNIDSDLLINGVGEILMNYGSGYSSLNAINGHTLTLDGGQTVHGQGTLSGNIVNYGTLQADVPGGTLVVSNPLDNHALINVAGGTFVLDQGLVGASVLSQLAAGIDGISNTRLIYSTLAVGNPGTAVGYSVSGNTYTMQYTWLGDANLDGLVNDDDLAALSATGTNWATGDFNYDGVVNNDDYALFMLGSAYGRVNISTTLPEPANLLISLGVILAGIRSRRRFDQ